MDVAFILDKYFKGTRNVSIDVFDAQTLNAVYRDVINAMTSHFEIEVSVLQALSYCFYEMMDNVHIHSGKPLGTAMTYYDDARKSLRILIADDGMGIRASLAENEKYKDICFPTTAAASGSVPTTAQNQIRRLGNSASIPGRFPSPILTRV